jgi:CheY-like chemotaxis protein
MSVKILLADDSPTVHKVIKIILKDDPYDIIECTSDSELMSSVSSHEPNLVFLDFNFSESQSGYELSKEIKTALPNCKILVMYGTFDNVDENLLKEIGVEQYVIKPFDTSKFRIQVNNLADGLDNGFEESSSVIDDGWTLKESVEVTKPAEKSVSLKSLDEDLSDWGVLIPGVIGKEDNNLDLPPIIEETSKIEPEVKTEAVGSKTEMNLPDESDLEYPDMDISSFGTSESSDEAEVPAPTSKLVPLNDLNDLDISLSDDVPSLDLTGLQDDEEEIAKRIEEQIKDEVEADLWTIDEVEQTQPKLKVVKNEEKPIERPMNYDELTKIEFGDTMDGGKSFDDFFEPLDKKEVRPTYTPAAQQKSSDAFDIESLRPILKDMINEAVAEYCRQHIDKVAWEVIPDLAENLIKNELKKLSDKVSRDL